ncbi:MAG: Fic family protein [Sphaerochaetaceae bacterium]|jgi:Fic family protein
MKYISIKEFSERWKISDSRIRLLCRQNRIEGAKKIGKSWAIPFDAPKPIDKREKVSEEFINLQFDFTVVDSLKDKIDKKRPFPKNSIASLHDKIVLEWTYNSNAIEGNSLTLSETKVVLEGITIGGKSLVEHLEIINHRDAILFVEQLVANQKILSEWDIKNIHALILKEIDNQNSGKYRSENVVISGAKHTPPKHYKIVDLMQQLIHQYNGSWKDYHPIVRATLFHGEFVKIHPFIDGNGRTARLLLNFELIRSGYAPIVMKVENRIQYYEVLDAAHTTMDYGPFIKMVEKLVVESEELWLSVLE